MHGSYTYTHICVCMTTMVSYVEFLHTLNALKTRKKTSSKSYGNYQKKIIHAGKMGETYTCKYYGNELYAIANKVRKLTSTIGTAVDVKLNHINLIDIYLQRTFNFQPHVKIIFIKIYVYILQEQ